MEACGQPLLLKDSDLTKLYSDGVFTAPKTLVFRKMMLVNSFICERLSKHVTVNLCIFQILTLRPDVKLLRNSEKLSQTTPAQTLWQQRSKITLSTNVHESVLSCSVGFIPSLPPLLFDTGTQSTLQKSTCGNSCIINCD